MTRFDAPTGRIEVYDGRETAPAAASLTMFLDMLAQPLPRGTAVTSGRATGVPGVVAMLGQAHRDHGRLAWRSLFEPTARRAEAGFLVTARLARYVHGPYSQNAMPDVLAYFTKSNGKLIEAGEALKNPAYEALLRRLAARGPTLFYRGDVAARIAAKVLFAPIPVDLKTTDIAAYRPVKRSAA